jgi:uncharacterized repeat protein (TIGR03803 family)
MMKSFTSWSLITFVSLCAAAHAQTFSVIHAFTGITDNERPIGGITVRAGTLYGTTRGFDENGGTAYQLTPSGSGWVWSPLLFGGQQFTPWDRIVFGPDNHPYGTSGGYGVSAYGFVFDLIPPLTTCKTADCFWSENVLYQFRGQSDGGGPYTGDLVWDQSGNIYGTTQVAGAEGVGTVYELMKSGNGWSEKVLHSFSGPDGEHPYDRVIFDGQGNLFGTTYDGGRYGFGTVFKLTPSGNGWVESTVYDFQDSTDGENPHGGLVIDRSGNLYGATGSGGQDGGGTIFELSPSGNAWTFNLLHAFSGACGPFASLSIDVAGNLYGTTYCDGSHNQGNIFKLANTQNGWVYTSLHDFNINVDGAFPLSGVTLDSNGTLYGTTFEGGDLNCFPPNGCGVVWQIKP